MSAELIQFLKENRNYWFERAEQVRNQILELKKIENVSEERMRFYEILLLKVGEADVSKETKKS